MSDEPPRRPPCLDELIPSHVPIKAPKDFRLGHFFEANLPDIAWLQVAAYGKTSSARRCKRCGEPLVDIHFFLPTYCEDRPKQIVPSLLHSHKASGNRGPAIVHESAMCPKEGCGPDHPLVAVLPDPGNKKHWNAVRAQMFNMGKVMERWYNKGIVRGSRR